MSIAESYEDMLAGDELYDKKQHSYVMASGKTEKCDSCIHKGICAFSKDYEKFCNELKEKCKLLEYQHFMVNPSCGHYMNEHSLKR